MAHHTVDNAPRKNKPSQASRGRSPLARHAQVTFETEGPSTMIIKQSVTCRTCGAQIDPKWKGTCNLCREKTAQAARKSPQNAPAIPFGLGGICSLCGELVAGREDAHAACAAMVVSTLKVDADGHMTGTPEVVCPCPRCRASRARGRSRETIGRELAGEPSTSTLELVTMLARRLGYDQEIKRVVCKLVLNGTDQRTVSLP